MACATCHARKVKCDLQRGGGPCTNCRTAGYECRPHQRKRKLHFRAATSPSTSSPAGPPDLPRHASLSGADAPEQQQQQPQPPPDGGDETGREESPEPAAQRGASGPKRKAGVEEAYVGRTEVLGGDVPFDESLVREQLPSAPPSFSAVDSQVLSLHRAFELPAQAERKRLLGHFMESCWPWTPIVDPAWLDDSKGRSPSPLLLHAVLLAGSRVSAEEALLSTEDFFRKARALFFYHQEPSSLLAVVAATILQWWSPTGPEQVSQSNSGFWIHVAMGLAYQVGLHKEPKPGPHSSLRRRIWWSLVCRDILISVGVGRPRTINLADSDVLPPTIRDFPKADTKSQVFVAYVEICQILGSVVEARRHNRLSARQAKGLESALYQWIRELPPALRLFTDTKPPKPTRYCVEARQLHVTYFVILIILSSPPDGPDGSDVPPSATSLVAASFIASIFAELGERDDVRRLGPVYAFHALASALALLRACQYAATAERANRDFDRLHAVLQRLAKKWGSARNLLRPLLAARRAAEAAKPKSESTPAPVPESLKPLFREFGPGLCLLWDLCSSSSPAAAAAPAGPALSARTPAAEAEAEAEVGVTDLQTPESAALQQQTAADEASPMWDFQPDDDRMEEPEHTGFLDAQQGMDYLDLERQWNELFNSWNVSGVFI